MSVYRAGPNNAFKPKPLRYGKGMAGKACHAFASTTRFGLTQALYAAETVSLIEEKSMSVTRVLDKTSSFGALVSAMSCAGCFPALGSLGAALGLGFLGQYEGFLFRKLLPGLAVLALLVNAWAWYRHRQLARGLLSVVGPIAVLAALLVFWSYDWSIYLFYAGIALMLVASILDLLRPVRAVQCPASN